MENTNIIKIHEILIKGADMKESIVRLKKELLEVQKLLSGEAEVLRHMSCEQCLLKSRAERLEKAAVTLKSGIETIDRWLEQGA